jgi:hypothetical protein
MYGVWFYCLKHSDVCEHTLLPYNVDCKFDLRVPCPCGVWKTLADFEEIRPGQSMYICTYIYVLFEALGMHASFQYHVNSKHDLLVPCPVEVWKALADLEESWSGQPLHLQHLEDISKSLNHPFLTTVQTSGLWKILRTFLNNVKMLHMYICLYVHRYVGWKAFLIISVWNCSVHGHNWSCTYGCATKLIMECKPIHTQICTYICTHLYANWTFSIV